LICNKVIRDSRGRFVKGSYPVNAYTKGHIPWIKGRKLSTLTEEEILERNRKKLHKWRDKDKGRYLKQYSRPKGLKGKVVRYSKEEIDLIFSFRDKGLSFTNIAIRCNIKFHNKKKVRKGNDVWGVMKRRKESSEILIVTEGPEVRLDTIEEVKIDYEDMA